MADPALGMGEARRHSDSRRYDSSRALRVLIGASWALTSAIRSDSAGWLGVCVSVADIVDSAPSMGVDAHQEGGCRLRMIGR